MPLTAHRTKPNSWTYLSFHAMIPVYPSAHSSPWPPPSSKNWPLSSQVYLSSLKDFYHMSLFKATSQGLGAIEGNCTYITSSYPGAELMERSQGWWLNELRKGTPVRLFLILPHGQPGPLYFQGSFVFIFPWYPRYGGGQDPDPCLISGLVAFLRKAPKPPGVQSLLGTLTSSPSLQGPVYLSASKPVLSAD